MKEKSRMDDNKSSSLGRFLETTKNAAEIIALAIGGLWAYQKFKQTELPALAPRLQVDTELNWRAVSDTGRHMASFNVDTTNISKADVFIKSVCIDIWITSIESSENTVSIVDPKDLAHGTPTYHRESDADPLAGHYAPDAKYNNEYDFLMPTSEHEIALFVWTATYGSGEPGCNYLIWTATRWAPLGGSDEKMPIAVIRKK